MKAAAMTVLVSLGLSLGAVNAQTPLDRQLVMDYISATGVQQGFDERLAELAKELAVEAPAGDAEKIRQEVESIMSMKEDFIALIERTFTAEELKKMIEFFRSPQGRSLSGKMEQFSFAMTRMIEKRAKLLDRTMTLEKKPLPISVVRKPGAPKLPSSSYVVPPQPVYPQESRVRGEQGVVHLRVLINTQGEAEAVGVTQSSGFPLMDEAALAALAKAKFKPIVENSIPVKSYAAARITFHLED